MLRNTVGSRIEHAADLSGLTLRGLAAKAGLKYNTLYRQVKGGRPIPFVDVMAIARATGLPCDFFEPRPTEPSQQSTDSPEAIAKTINKGRAETCRAGFDVTTDHILDWHRENEGLLANHKWFEDQLDLYERVAPTDRIMKPIKFGEKSITAERLVISRNEDFFERADEFGRGVIDRAMLSHRALDDLPFVVTEESLNVSVKGLELIGSYRKVTMRIFRPCGTPITGVFSKLTRLQSCNQLRETLSGSG